MAWVDLHEDVAGMFAVLASCVGREDFAFGHVIDRSGAPQRKWDAANPDKVKEYRKRHNAKPETKERKNAWLRAYRAAKKAA